MTPQYKQSNKLASVSAISQRENLKPLALVLAV